MLLSNLIKSACLLNTTITLLFFHFRLLAIFPDVTFIFLASTVPFSLAGNTIKSNYILALNEGRKRREVVLISGDARCLSGKR